MLSAYNDRRATWKIMGTMIQVEFCGDFRMKRIKAQNTMSNFVSKKIISTIDQIHPAGGHKRATGLSSLRSRRVHQ